MVRLIVIKAASWSGQYLPVKSLFSSPAAICKPKQSLQTLKSGELWFVFHAFHFLLHMMDGGIYCSSEEQTSCYSICPRQAALATAKNNSHGPWKDSAQKFWKNSPLGQGASMEKCSPKGQHFAMLMAHGNRRLWWKVWCNPGDDGCSQHPCPSSCHGAITCFPCHIVDWILLPLKAEFCRSTMTPLLSTKTGSWSWAFSALSGQMFALAVWKITFHIFLCHDLCWW